MTDWWYEIHLKGDRNLLYLSAFPNSDSQESYTDSATPEHQGLQGTVPSLLLENFRLLNAFPTQANE